MGLINSHEKISVCISNILVLKPVIYFVLIKVKPGGGLWRGSVNCWDLIPGRGLLLWHMTKTAGGSSLEALLFRTPEETGAKSSKSSKSLDNYCVTIVSRGSWTNLEGLINSHEKISFCVYQQQPCAQTGNLLSKVEHWNVQVWQMQEISMPTWEIIKWLSKLNHKHIPRHRHCFKVTTINNCLCKNYHSIPR